MSYTPIQPDEPVEYSQPATGNVNSSGPSDPVPTKHASTTENSFVQRIKESSHPVALIFYIAFRTAPIFLYIFGNVILGFVVKQNRFVLHFILLILLIAVDFWNLKNISGRLLVGLRWWNEVNPIKGREGEFENVWVFETYSADRVINSVDSKFFWLLLYAQPVAWVLFAILALLKFQFLYLLLIGIALSLSLTNAFAFTKCDKFSKANNLATDLFSRATGSLFGRFMPFST